MKNKILAIALTLLSHAAFAGTIINGDFSDGLNGWTTAGNVSVQGNTAQLQAGSGTDVYTTLSQTLHLSAGDVLTSSAHFFPLDVLGYDDAFVRLAGNDLFYATGTTDAGVVNFQYTVGTAGDYVLTAGVANHGDNFDSSILVTGPFAVASNDGPGNNVPEPASVALLGLGLLGVAAARRKAGGGA